MNANHLSYFKVENFKRFEQFEANDIGQFNLVLGDNNVGKTTWLEALLFDDKNVENYVYNLIEVLHKRQIMKRQSSVYMRESNDFEENLLAFYVHNNQVDKEIITAFEYNDEGVNELRAYADTENLLSEKYPLEYNSSFKNKMDDDASQRLYWVFQNNLKVSFHRQQSLIRPRKQAFPFVFFAQTYGDDLVQLFSDFVQSDKEPFIESLKLFIPKIKDIEIRVKSERENLLYVRETDNSFMPISMYGDGANRLIRILLTIPSCKGKRLMIDEVDAGIHFKKFNDFWKIILKTAHYNNVQLFGTTHNIECIKTFKDVLENDDMKSFQPDARCFELVELPNGSVKAYTYHFEEFKTMLETNTNIRGGNYQ